MIFPQVEITKNNKICTSRFSFFLFFIGDTKRVCTVLRGVNPRYFFLNNLQSKDIIGGREGTDKEMKAL